MSTAAPQITGTSSAWSARVEIPRLVAHRGAPRVRRENTLPSVAAAEAIGVSAVEIDVRRTADGTAVLLHDPTLGRLWGDGRRVADMSWSDLATVGNDLDHVPRLIDALDRLSGTGTSLLIDVAEAEDAPSAVRAVMESDADVVVAWCGAPDAMAIVREALDDADVWLAWQSLRTPTAEDIAELHPSTLNLDVAFVTAEIVRAAHDLGLAVACWTVDDPELAVWAARAGVDSITTNDVPSIKPALAAADRDGWPDAERAQEEHHVVARASRLAHRIAHEVIVYTREHPFTEVSTKSGIADLVTDVDRAIEQQVRGRVRAAFPTHGFTGEEFGEAPGGPYRWYLDPVDGTTNLVNGVPWTSMSLCMGRGNRALVAVVADPWRGEVMEAQRGRGATLDGRRIQLDEQPTVLAGTVVGTELDGHRPWPGFIAFLEALAAESCTLRVLGSGTLTLAQVAAGRGIGACVSSFSTVDHGASILLVQEAGGVVIGLDGPVSGFPKVGEPVLVARPGAAAALERVWRSAIAGAPSAP